MFHRFGASIQCIIKTYENVLTSPLSSAESSCWPERLWTDRHHIFRDPCAQFEERFVFDVIKVLGRDFLPGNSIIGAAEEVHCSVQSKEPAAFLVQSYDTDNVLWNIWKNKYVFGGYVMLIILIAFKNSNNNFHKANVELMLQKSPFALAYLVKGNLWSFLSTFVPNKSKTTVRCRHCPQQHGWLMAMRMRFHD